MNERDEGPQCNSVRDLVQSNYGLRRIVSVKVKREMPVSDERAYIVGK